MPTNVITPLPPAPTRASPDDFNTKADAFVSALGPFGAELNLLATELEGYAVDAETSAIQAAASATSTIQATNVNAWVSGTTYAVGVTVYDTVDFFTYRRKIAGAGTTRPGLDSTNWQLITGQGDVTTAGTQTLTNKTISGLTNTLTNITASSLDSGIVIPSSATATTQASNDSSTKVATTAFVKNETPVIIKSTLNAEGNAPLSACRAWVNFNGSSATIRASFNVSSVTRNSVGDYTVNLTNAMPDANYAEAVTGTQNSAGNNISIGLHPSVSKTASSVRIFQASASFSPVDSSDISVAIFR